MAVQERLITADEFWEIAQSDAYRDKRIELVHGEIIEMAGSSPLNTIVAGRILTFLNIFVLPRNIGYVTGADGAFQLTPLEIRLPDVAFISKTRYPKIERVFPIPPDLAVEVVSAHDRASEIRDKVRLYLTNGTQLVWAVYPEDQTVDVHRLNDDGKIVTQSYAIGDTLDGGDVLPDFQLPVADIFPPENQV